MFDWIRFLDSYSIEYVLGPAGQVRRDHVGICCPRCGDDEKFHFNISLDDGKIRGCWRDGDHWMPPAQLIAEVGHIPYASAKKMLEEGSIGDIKIDSLKAQLEALDAPPQEDILPLMQWPTEIQQISAAAAAPSGKMYWQYMRERGFFDPGAVGGWYGLKWCSTGDWSHRILFPLKNWEGGLVGWTGRDITGTSNTKYKTEPKGEGVAGLVFGYELGMSGRILCLTEGPIDAVVMDYYAQDRPVHAVAMLGLNAGKKKWGLIEKLSRSFDEVVIMLDRGEDATAHALRDQLSVLNAKVGYVPDHRKDPGEMTPKEVGEWWDELL